MNIREVNSGSYKVGKPCRLKMVARVGIMHVWAKSNRAKGDKPYVVGRVFSGRRILLEEFSRIRDARLWAVENERGSS